MSAFRDAGLRVPDDISVVGFDDIQAASYVRPRLTTVRQPLRRMGEMAAKQLLERISNGNGRCPQLISLTPEFVVRESTGPAILLPAE
jgi:LacI family transcriptional regulator